MFNVYCSFGVALTGHVRTHVRVKNKVQRRLRVIEPRAYTFARIID